MNGPLLVVLGAIWAEVRLSATARNAAFWAALYGTYVNWLTTVAAAAFGTAALSPITAGGHHALPWQEALVTIGFATAGLGIAIATVLVLWGVRRVAIA